jgi:hypothetical protein
VREPRHDLDAALFPNRLRIARSRLTIVFVIDG